MTEAKVSEQWLRDLFAAELDKFGELPLANIVRRGSDNSHGGRAALAAMKVATGELFAALGPMRTALQKQVDLLRFQARNSTAGVARTLIETAEGWQALCDNAEAAIAMATELQRPAGGTIRSAQGSAGGRADDRKPPVGPAPTSGAKP